MVRRASLQLLSYLVMSVLAIYSLYIAIQPRTVSFFIDGTFAPRVVQQCQTLLTPEFLQKNSSSAALQTIQNHIVGLSTCSIRYRSFQKAHVTIKALTPFVRVNENLILTAAGSIAPAAELQEVVLERLPRIKADDPTLSQAETVANLFSFMRALPENLLENHALIWIDKTTIYIIDQASPEIALLAAHNTRFTPDLMQSVMTLTKQIMEDHKKKGRMSQKKIIDVRVKGQIIIKHMQGGDYENTSGEKYYNSN